MKKGFIFLGLLMAVFLATSCTVIPAGYVCLKVDKLGTGAGSVTEEKPGYKFNMNPNIDYIGFPEFTKTYNWTEASNPDLGSPTDEAIRFQTSEGLKIVADIGITFTINKEQGTASGIYLKYRDGLDELLHGPVRNYVRDSFIVHGSKYTADQIIGDSNDKLIKEVYDDVKEHFAPSLEVSTLSWLSSPRPPQNIIDALNAKVQAAQLTLQKENEVKSAKAEADKSVETARGKAQSILVEAEAQAKSNRLLAESITSNLIQIKWIEKWSGNLPTVVSGSGGGVILDYKSLSSK